MRLGVFGGTFDPPHMAHLIVAQDALEALRLDRVLFVPAAIPPHKRGERLTPTTMRLAMLRAAVGDDARFEICELELRRQGPSYTLDTLRELQAERPDDELVLIMGTDQWREFATWRGPGEIRELAEIAVVGRDGEEAGGGGGERGGGGTAGGTAGVRFIDVTRIGISSTLVRERVADGRSARYLVPEGVWGIIEREGLYRG